MLCVLFMLNLNSNAQLKDLLANKAIFCSILIFSKLIGDFQKPFKLISVQPNNFPVISFTSNCFKFMFCSIRKHFTVFCPLGLVLANAVNNSKNLENPPNSSRCFGFKQLWFLSIHSSKCCVFLHLSLIFKWIFSQFDLIIYFTSKNKEVHLCCIYII